MLKHRDIWRAIDQLATNHSLSASGLARRAGLDATSFNPSKRIAPDGKPRWPSTESISKILECTGENLSNFNELVTADKSGKKKGKTTPVSTSSCKIPMINLSKTNKKGIFDGAGFPLGKSWDHLTFPAALSKGAYALQISSDTLAPVYRKGDTLIIEPDCDSFRKGDRVIIRTMKGEIMIRQLEKFSSDVMILKSINNKQRDITLSNQSVEWIARILWVSQ